MRKVIKNRGYLFFMQNQILSWYLLISIENFHIARTWHAVAAGVGWDVIEKAMTTD
jgi:hypothetical protein